jgi:hypothetical protein
LEASAGLEALGSLLSSDRDLLEEFSKVGRLIMIANDLERKGWA